MSDEVIATTKVFDRGKTTIPSEMRGTMEISDGDKIVWLRDNNGRYYVEKVKRTISGVRFQITERG